MNIEKTFYENDKYIDDLLSVLKSIQSNPLMNVLNANLSTWAHRKVEDGSEEFLEYIGLTLKQYRIVKDGLADFELVKLPVGSDPISGKNDDRYKQWFHFVWRLTERGEEVLALAQQSKDSSVFFDTSSYTQDIKRSVEVLEEHLESDQIVDHVMTKAANSNIPEFDNIRQKFIVEKLARTKKNQFLVRT